ncbi:MAG: arsenite methyltransferase [Pseudomonadota bacterium]
MKCECSDKQDILSVVSQVYGKIAKQEGSCCDSPLSCCGGISSAHDIAISVGYSSKELEALPDGANMGLSCGNPTAIASLEPGEIVLDIGSGGGFDVFIAAKKVGPSGYVIGVDMTPDMIAKARRNIKSFKEKTGQKNVEFRLGEIEHLPVADACVDVVISNCVINLSPDKPQVWREIARALKPDGRVSISDIALLRPLPENIRKSVNALVGCIAEAALINKIQEMIRAAGLVEEKLETKTNYIDQMIDLSDPRFSEIASSLPAGTRLSDYAVSITITARKPTLDQ